MTQIDLKAKLESLQSEREGFKSQREKYIREFGDIIKSIKYCKRSEQQLTTEILKVKKRIKKENNNDKRSS